MSITYGQELIVQVGYTATPTELPTATPPAGPRAHLFQRRLLNPFQPAESEEEEMESGAIFGMDRQTMGLALILICRCRFGAGRHWHGQQGLRKRKRTKAKTRKRNSLLSQKNKIIKDR